METSICFGIDLGTTNSAIAKFVKGDVTVYNNPSDYGRSTLPSVVSFRKDKIIVGSKAKELFEKDPKSTVGVFKRKMGTAESFKIRALNESRTPIELSAMVLKELKTFLPPNENMDAAVITIPASFDMIQSNATKEAGYLAGLKQVVLLQEPIAASLAYANSRKKAVIGEGQWLVYDLGGGTFDVALIRIDSGEMKVIDHEGDNFLGGADFDRLIVEKLVIPKLEHGYSFTNLEDSLKSASGKRNGTYYRLLQLAEEAKITLSSKTSEEIEVSGLLDDEDNEVDTAITVTRSEFNSLIMDQVDRSIDMVKKIMTRNSLTPADIQFVLMVGGSTYIPFVRQRVEEVLQITANCDIDPTTAVALGAAFYAATKPKEVKENKKVIGAISIKAAYQKSSKESEELFSAKVTGQLDALFYRITRQDGGYDSGIKKLRDRISEDLPLVDMTYNIFRFAVYDSHNNIVETNLETIEINSGYSIAGQPLPEDVCLEIDNEEIDGLTSMFLIFQRGTILPTKKTITRVLNKGLIKGSDDVIRINILEGPQSSLPEANKSVGYLEISGVNLIKDVSKGSDIELTFTVSESRDLSVSAYLNMADQEFTQTFKPKVRSTPVSLLKIEIEKLEAQAEEELHRLSDSEEFERASELNKLIKEISESKLEVDRLTSDDVTDKRYQLEDKKRRLAQEFEQLTKDKRLTTAKEQYYKSKEDAFELLVKVGNDHDQKTFADLTGLEISYLSSNSILRISELNQQMGKFYWALWRKDPISQKEFFQWLKSQKPKANDPIKADALYKAGEFTLQTDDIERLNQLNFEIYSLMPKTLETPKGSPKIGF